MKPEITTLGQLRKNGYRVLPVKEEMRKNLIQKLRKRERLFPGIIGFDDTVIPQVINAILAKHDVVLLGLRGQAKTRIARQMVNFLDEYTPVIKGAELNDNPFSPVSKFAADAIRDHGDNVAVDWIHRSERYGEKLATPDVTVADLIGDIDPIKAATQRLHYSHEGAIHFGIIPRSNRGIFVINELPDLQPRIQVGLFNIMQERDVQIRGFNVRIPLDVCLVFTANPEDYTHRGSIVTPLKDRIDAQILTHYPKTLEDGMTITEQEAWIHRDAGQNLMMPLYCKQIVESVAVIARSSEFVDQSSGVSARLTIATMEAAVSNAERRAIMHGETAIMPRICDLSQAITGITGKVELVFEGENEGPAKVAKALLGKAVREVFKMHFPDPLTKKRKKQGSEQTQNAVSGPYGEIVRWFEQGNAITVSDTMPIEAFFRELNRVPTLADLAAERIGIPRTNKYELASAMEFVLDALHQNSKVAKDDGSRSTVYRDMVGSIFPGMGGGQGRFPDEEEMY